MKRLLIIFLCFAAYSVSADVVFSGLDLSENNQLLFSAETSGLHYGQYRTLFSGNVKKRTMEQLTFFPERIVLLENGSVLQIQNRFGIFRSTSKFTAMKAVSRFPSFISGNGIQTGKIQNIEASPDGRYLLYYHQKSVSYGDLVLFDVKEKKETVISKNVGLSFDTAVAKWSPNSRFFIFVKKGTLYYYSLDQLVASRVFAEKLRAIGTGSIKSVNWSARNDLYYVKTSRVYKILTAEFFTRALYHGILEMGDIIGKIPFTFDPNFDRFTISPDGRKILLDKGGRNLFLYFLRNDDYLSIGTIKSLPYLYLPRNTRVKRIIWSGEDLVTIFTVGIHNGEPYSSLFRINLFTQSGKLMFTQTPDSGVQDISLSSDGKTVALLRPDSIELKNYATWKTFKIIKQLRPLHILWRNAAELVIAGAYRTVLADLEKGTEKTVLLSQVGEYGFTKKGAVFSKLAGKTYIYSAGKNGEWKSIASVVSVSPHVSSENYRVYFETNSRGNYRNLIMVRDIKGYGTRPLFPVPVQIYEPFPKKDEPISWSIFSHGSRIRRREVSLVFNAVDSVEGLTRILQTLSEYGIRATFFLNGEFIHRNPDAVKELSKSNNEIGSLFYTYFNMTDSRYRVDSEFVKQGLGRNEDDYFALTGKELSLLWHAPYYYVNSTILKAAREMNYQYIGRDIDPLDWVSSGDCSSVDLYKSSRDIIEDIMKQKEPGSIIPIRIGEVAKGRKDYLFQHLDLLINGLLSRGYRIVPVTTLMEDAK